MNQHNHGKEQVPRLTASKEKVEGNYKSTVILKGWIDIGTDENYNIIETFEFSERNYKRVSFQQLIQLRIKQINQERLKWKIEIKH